MLFLRFIINIMNEVKATWKGSPLWENIHSICEITLQAPTAICYNTILTEISLWMIHSVNSVQSLSRIQLFVTPWTAAQQASLSIKNSQNPPNSMSIESVMPSKHLILCHPLLFLPSIFLSISVFSNESALCNRWPKYWIFSLSISLSNEHPGLFFPMNTPLGWTGWISLQSKGLSRVFSNTTVQKHQFIGAQLSL